ncbi:MAG: RNA-binding protein [Bacteroidales bacterium]|nr:RNA-binding protein [Bacteroidales bacterium]
MNIFVAKLSPETKNEDLQELFEEFGVVNSAKVIMDRETGNSKRYGFVEMENDDEAMSAIERLNDSEFDNSRIVVKKARPKIEQRRPSYSQRRY